MEYDPLEMREDSLDDSGLALSTQRHFSVVSMFSGCGGMDLGFRGGFEFLGQKFEKHPFDIIWANDINVAACRTYKANLGHNIHEGSVWDVLTTLPKQSDVVIGGFPCQDISINGKGAGIDGARSGLYRAMVSAVQQIRPRIFVAENVKGLLMRHNREALKTVLHDFRDLGYEVSCELYRTADYGVPQSRERVFIVGTLPDTRAFERPDPTRTKDNWLSASEAISDLEKLKESPSFNHIWSRAKKSPEQGNRSLKADRPAYTIRAECHGNIQYHYNQPRRISMREAARIQSFPDDFIFHSKLRETERQVGNAVPPLMGWHIAKSVLKALKPL